MSTPRPGASGTSRNPSFWTGCGITVCARPSQSSSMRSRISPFGIAASRCSAAYSATGPSEPECGAIMMWCASAIAAIFFICVMPPARPVSGWMTSTSSRSISSRSPKIVAMRSPAASGTLDGVADAAVALEVLRRDRVLDPIELDRARARGTTCAASAGVSHGGPCRSIAMSMSSPTASRIAATLRTGSETPPHLMRGEAALLQQSATSGVLAWP